MEQRTEVNNSPARGAQRRQGPATVGDIMTTRLQSLTVDATLA